MEDQFFNCIEEKIIDSLSTIRGLLSDEFAETDMYASDPLILSRIDETISLLHGRIDRVGDRCSEKGCIRKSSRFNSAGESKCKYH